jgi:hypothetical protein
MSTGRRRISRTLTRWLLGPVLLWGLLALLSRCVQFRMSDKKVKAYFAGSPAPPAFAFTDAATRSIHYACPGGRHPADGGVRARLAGLVGRLYRVL